MDSISLPAVFALLGTERNRAVDAALVDALPLVEEELRAPILDMLVKRGTGGAVATLVGRFDEFDTGVRELMRVRADGLSGGIRVAITSTKLEQRLNAISFIRNAKHCKSAYLLSDVLRMTCLKSRRQAAAALVELAREVKLDYCGSSKKTDVVWLHSRAQYVSEGLRAAVRIWEAHRDMGVIRAAAWMVEFTGGAIRKKLTEPRTRIGYALNELLDETADPLLAEFALYSLAIEPIRVAASRAIARATSLEFLESMVQASWLLGDPPVALGFRRVRRLYWLEDGRALLMQMDGRALARVLRVAAAYGGPRDKYVQVLAELMNHGREDARREALWALVRDQSDAATRLLTTLASRGEDAQSELAAQELRVRTPGVARPPSVPTSGVAEPHSTEQGDGFARYWDLFDVLDVDSRRTIPGDLGLPEDRMLQQLRAKLADGDAECRARALRVVGAIGFARGLDEQIYHASYDMDPSVRAIAIRLLSQLPGATTDRILRVAVDDTDHRVQANAVEVLDEMDANQRLELTRSKLKSTNSRVRANAVKSLLRAELSEAGDALLEMLDSDSRANRLSALWVVNRLRLRSVIQRIERLSRDDPDDRVRARARRLLNDLSNSVEAVGSLSGHLGEGGWS